MKGEDPHQGSGPQLQRRPERSRKTARVSSIPCRPQNGWNKKVWLGGQGRLSMTVSEKSHGTAKSGPTGGGGVLERGKHSKTQITLSHLSLSACLSSTDSKR